MTVTSFAALKRTSSRANAERGHAQLTEGLRALRVRHCLALFDRHPAN